MKKIIVTIVAVCITTASLKAQQSLKRLEDYTGTPEYNTIVTNYLIGNIFDSIGSNLYLRIKVNMTSPSSISQISAQYLTRKEVRN